VSENDGKKINSPTTGLATFFTGEAVGDQRTII
jgi:hypothetical protein